MQLGAMDSLHSYAGPIDCLRQLMRAEGWRGLARGLGGTMAREMPGNASEWVCRCSAVLAGMPRGLPAPTAFAKCQLLCLLPFVLWEGRGLLLAPHLLCRPWRRPTAYLGSELQPSN